MHVVVVGGGIAGLVASIDARALGMEVTLLESRPDTGGKVRTVTVGGKPIDRGPTVLTMRWVFDELFRETGAELSSVLETRPLDVLARHAWGDTQLDLYRDVSRTREAIAEVFGERDADAYVAFAARTKQIYETALGPFLRSQRPTMAGMLAQAAKMGPWALHTIDAHRTLQKALESTFADERLVQLFGRYATYTGSSPVLAPATLALIAHVERDGVEVVKGGMVALRDALEARARELGVSFVRGAHVRKIATRNGRVSHVVWDGAEIGADAVMFAGDVSALGTGLLGDDVRSAARVVPREERSLSAVTFSLVGRVREGSTFTLDHHNVFFPDARGGGKKEHETLFATRGRAMPSDPTVYVCAQDRGPFAPGVRGEPERLFAILNAPADGDTSPLSDEDIERCKDRMISRLEASGLSLDVSTSTAHTPTSFAEAYPGSGGALYGAASHGAFSALNRPSARTKVKGLYLVGGSVHPGAGVPMAALSGRLGVAALSEDLPSTARSRRAATTGSISTR